MIDFDNIARRAIQAIGEEWMKQGHDLTGKFRESIAYKIRTEGGSTFIDITDGTESGYGVILNKGVPAERIPYNPGSGAGKSKYITGLANYAKLRMGASDKDAVSIAFAIATKHKREGMPTKASERFSQTGKRTRFVEDTIERIDDIVNEEIGKEWKRN